MKKILLIVPSLHQGGLENVCVRTARMLAPYYEIDIAIFDSRDIAYDVEGLHIFNLNLPSRPSRMAKVFRVLHRGYKLRLMKKRGNYEVAYSFGPTANLANISSGGKTRKLLSIHSYMDMGNPGQIRLFCKKADMLLCCSAVICKEVQEKYHCKKAVTLNNPFDLKEIERMGEEKITLPWTNGRVLVSMGREDVVKGFWHLIKGFSVVHKKLPDTRLMIIGKGDFTPYKKLAEELGVGQYVYFTGLQKNPYAYLANSDVYVLTSYNEGFPNALIEAMTLGLPVVSTDCMTGPKEIILEDEYGILVPNMSPEMDLDAGNISKEECCLADRIVDLLEDTEKMEHYRQMSIKRAQDFDQKVYIEKLKNWIS